MGITIWAEEKKHWWSCSRIITVSEEEFNTRKKWRGGALMCEDGPYSEFSTRARSVKPKAQINFLPEFVGAMKQRLDMGEKKYGEKSYLTDNLFTDVKEELLDAANYIYLLYARIRRLEKGEKVSDYLNFCNAVDITTDADRDKLENIFKVYKVCHRIAGREYHYCKKGE
jgi:hypothetical protein